MSARPRSTLSPRGAGVLLAAVACLPVPRLLAQGPPRLLGWNDLGMHCMDNDFSIFSILPPFNTFHAQLVVGGQLVTGGNYTVTYEAVADPNGSINKSSIGKTEFWQHAPALFGVNLPVDEGLAGFRMPGAANTPQSMGFNPSIADWEATGVPITPTDDNLVVNPYPMMRLVARNGAGQQVASTRIVLPVSGEVACSGCHASGGNPAARPANGWLYAPTAIDDRVNILKLHDDRHGGQPVYTAALAALGYSPSGLYDTAVNQNTAVLCAACHASVALGANGQPGVPSMTSAMHTLHGNVRLPDGRLLANVDDRTSCYTCHPGARTRCLRGAMGKAIGADGESMMSCQNCHEGMMAVGHPGRTGWLEEPNCQACHTGDAVSNAGAIRFADAFDAPGHLRTTTNQRFATDPDTPAAGYSLYRFSTGHGELECSACHGSTHAIFPSSEANDNLQSIDAQGHAGTIVECSACHSNLEDNQLIGPHGMHPTGQFWVGKHQDVAEQMGTASCRPCHGTDYRGTVLSRALADRSVSTQFGQRNFWKGYEVGCYDCHNGPNNEHSNNNSPPVVANRSESTPTDQPLALTLTATDPNSDPTTLRIVDQPQHGAVAFDGANAVYRARDGYVGTDSFTYAAADGESNSNRGTVTIDVQPATCAGSAESFGFGCGGVGGDVPTLSAVGCPTGGQQVDLVLADGLPTGPALIALGYGRGLVELGTDGCTFRVATLLANSPLLLLNNGTASHTITVPNGFPDFDLTAQGFHLDPAAPRGYRATPGLEVHFR
ncbi:MAG: hypothetical protein KDE27_25965 [Planctomycetes bacterium]|nr:hypothetical protein [Planctomycetota bacterium]